MNDNAVIFLTVLVSVLSALQLGFLIWISFGLLNDVITLLTLMQQRLSTCKSCDAKRDGLKGGV